MTKTLLRMLIVGALGATAACAPAPSQIARLLDAEGRPVAGYDAILEVDRVEIGRTTTGLDGTFAWDRSALDELDELNQGQVYFRLRSAVDPDASYVFVFVPTLGGELAEVKLARAPIIEVSDHAVSLLPFERGDESDQLYERLRFDEWLTWPTTDGPLPIAALPGGSAHTARLRQHQGLTVSPAVHFSFPALPDAIPFVGPGADRLQDRDDETAFGSKEGTLAFGLAPSTVHSIAVHFKQESVELAATLKTRTGESLTASNCLQLRYLTYCEGEWDDVEEVTLSRVGTALDGLEISEIVVR